MARSSRSGCTARTTFHLVGPQSWTAVPAALVYDSSDPFAVRVRFGDGATDDVEPALYDDPDDDGGVEWLLSRDLLRAGLTGPVGEGDVRLWPARGGLDVLFLQLRAPSGEAMFELSGAVVGDFLRETELLVPAGGESDLLRVDEELSALLRGGTDNPTGR
ncbi:Sporulation and cell division protein, SsgA [Modestobacter italicus]|uniref:Sporulation and cell division protein, SsgA n=1 Tax=Modestobacter italicus (strain DSM 44449 / CECT 9708 / BC 501) TaxID=2732864 RepID=I4EZH4_MODI5|nr:SsgA family sporulation/cell division regulator [Modestobacter marinus]CCH88787.1 Sporulation and cell division protein, SsgA [Modestobacter marinus]